MTLLRDLTSKRWIYAKGLMFVVLGFMSGGLLLLDQPTVRSTILLVICVWAFCRAYYFAFYVVEHYVDPAFRFAGLVAFVRYLLSQKQSGQ
jgi:hypothetical protein